MAPDQSGKTATLRRMDEGIWLVSFMHYDPGHIDLEQKTLQAIDNLFGTRLSPMSPGRTQGQVAEGAGLASNFLCP